MAQPFLLRKNIIIGEMIHYLVRLQVPKRYISPMEGPFEIEARRKEVGVSDPALV